MPNTTEEYIEELDEQAIQIVRLFREVSSGMTDDILPSTGKGDIIRCFSGLNGATRETQQEFLMEYEKWYVASEELVGEYLPKRETEFEERYSKVISLAKFQHHPEEYSLNETIREVEGAINFQRRVVSSIPAKLRARRHRLRESISKQVGKDGLLQARKLLDEGLTRASGVTAGVALEQYLLTLCDQAEDTIDYKHDDGINSLAQTLYKADQIDKTTLNSLQTLASIRNDCAHANQEEPNQYKVRRLIEDTEDYLRDRGL